MVIHASSMACYRQLEYTAICYPLEVRLARRMTSDIMEIEISVPLQPLPTFFSKVLPAESLLAVRLVGREDRV